MKILSGLPACEGLVAGQIVCVPENTAHIIPSYSITEQEIAAETKRLKTALQAAQAHLAVLLSNNTAKDAQGISVEQKILHTHQIMLADDAFMQTVYAAVASSLMNAEHVLKQKVEEAVAMLTASKDAYLCNRAADIQDAFESVFFYLSTNTAAAASRFEGLPHSALLAARMIKPSEALEIKRLDPCGIILEESGVTGHIAIIARSWNIPMLVAVPDLMATVKTGMQAVLDSSHKTLILEPDQETVMQIERRMSMQKTAELEITGNYTQVSTKDGIPVYLHANLTFTEEAAQPLVQNTAGIGLFRSEFLFLGKHTLPDEEEQYNAYRTVLEHMKEKPVVIRTFDAGADKMLEEQEALGEKNALLGWRAIRYCLDRPDIFKTQLRALMRAACYGNLYILIPMISCMKEVRAVRNLITEIEHECEEQKVPYKKNIPLGIMIEVPSAAIAADLYAPAVDFFSIGTNDLIQYTVAVDRENTTVAHLADCFHPAVLRLIRHIIEAEPLLRNETGGFVSMCGEMASREEALPILLGMGLRRFSMVPQKIPAIARRIADMNLADTQAFFKEICCLDSPEEIRRRVRERFPL